MKKILLFCSILGLAHCKKKHSIVDEIKNNIKNFLYFIKCESKLFLEFQIPAIIGFQKYITLLSLREESNDIALLSFKKECRGKNKLKEKTSQFLSLWFQPIMFLIIKTIENYFNSKNISCILKEEAQRLYRSGKNINDITNQLKIFSQTMNQKNYSELLNLIFCLDSYIAYCFLGFMHNTKGLIDCQEIYEGRSCKFTENDFKELYEKMIDSRYIGKKIINDKNFKHHKKLMILAKERDSLYNEKYNLEKTIISNLETNLIDLQNDRCNKEEIAPAITLNQNEMPTIIKEKRDLYDKKSVIIKKIRDIEEKMKDIFFLHKNYTIYKYNFLYKTDSKFKTTLIKIKNNLKRMYSFVGVPILYTVGIFYITETFHKYTSDYISKFIYGIINKTTESKITTDYVSNLLK